MDTRAAHRQAPATRLQGLADGPIASRLGLYRADLGALHDLAGESRQIPKGAHVRLRGREPEFAVLVLSGLLFRYIQKRDGRRQVVALYFPGDWATLEALVATPLEGQIAALVRT